MNGRQGKPQRPYSQAHRRLRGACAFTPELTRECRLDLHSPRGGDASFAIGIEDVELSLTSDGSLEGQASRSAIQLDGEALREICTTLEFGSAPIVHDARLVLMDIAPRCAHAYWEVSPLRLTKLHLAYGDAFDQAEQIIRFYEVAYFDEAQVLHQFDITVAAEQQHYRNEFWEAGKRYVAEMGFRLPDGQFLCLARSNAVELPRESAAAERAPAYMHVEHNRTLPQRPPLPALFCLTDPEATVKVEPVDHPLRDIQAERHVRDVYLRVRNEGPRVLAGRPAIQPTPAAEREAQYEERLRKRQDSSQSREETLTVPPTLDRDLGLDSLDLLPDLAPGQDRPHRFKSSPLSDRLTAQLPTRALTVAMAATAAAQQPDIIHLDLDVPPQPELPTVMSSQEPVLQSDSFTGGLDLQLSSLTPEVPTASSTPIEHHPAPLVIPVLPEGIELIDEEPTLLPVEVISHREKNASVNEEAGFTAGLGIQDAPEPARPLVVPRQARTQRPQRRKASEPLQPPADFCAGLDLLQSPKVLPEKPEAKEVAQPISPVIAEESTSQRGPQPSVASQSKKVNRRRDREESRHEKKRNRKESTGRTASSTKETNEAAATSLTPSRQQPPAAAAEKTQSFNITVSLNLEGTVPEGHSIELDGQEITIDSCGKFSLTCSLENGKLTLPFSLRDEKRPRSSHDKTISLSIADDITHGAWDSITLKPSDG